VNRIIFIVFYAVLFIYVLSQLIYFKTFRTMFSFMAMFGVGADVLEFSDTIWAGIKDNIIAIILFISLYALTVFLTFKVAGFERIKGRALEIRALVLVPAIGLFALLTAFYHNGDIPAAFDGTWRAASDTEELGVFLSAVKDAKNVAKTMSGGNSTDKVARFETSPTPIPTSTPLPTSTPEPVKPEEEVHEPDVTPTETPTPTPTPVDRSPQILYDFAKFADAAPNEDVKELLNLLNEEEYTYKNEYTGFLKGYNLIFITAEGFAPYAMSEEITPTLWKLSHEGFVFNNFYDPYWETSTSDGEFINLTGLIPSGTLSLKRFAGAGKDMGFSLGNRFGKLGYTTYAFHNNTYNYYDRNLTHPALGYTYMGYLKKGTTIDDVPEAERAMILSDYKCWPNSDLEMMQKSLPYYINEDHFHTYYMTVSGHFAYTFTGNRMASKNKDVVKDLNLSDYAKAYIACNYELELAVRYLVEQLEAAGKMDNTLIVLCCDHYPYGLTRETDDNSVISELIGHEVEPVYEICKETLIMWTPSIKEPIIVDKLCGSADIMPTLLNLFGFDYDSRLFAGKDIFSSNDGLVIFNDDKYATSEERNKYGVRELTTFMTEDYSYDAVSHSFTNYKDGEISQTSVEKYMDLIYKRKKISEEIVNLDLYKYLPEQ
ncbi:MAG: LTA synthase family protein, partial [Lachnospiraceae bacterium]|nr:LTA synthase family protein [Lachnospiraceae bacterium]